MVGVVLVAAGTGFPGRGSQARFPSKVPRNRFTSKVPKRL